MKNVVRIPTYRVQEEYDLLMSLPASKPSTRMVRTKRGLKAMKALIDLEKNHNVSWYRFLKERADKNKDKIALFYRGTEITYSEMMEKADKAAKSLVAMGIKPGDEIPICMTNTPELVYLLIAINKIGAKANIFGEQFNHEYINEIIDGCSKKVLFTDDSRYDYIKDAVNASSIENKVVISLSDSLPKDPKSTKNYDHDLDAYYHYENKVGSYKSEDSSVYSFDEFVSKSSECTADVEYIGDLETDFLVTYTSGSTIVGKPKPIQHSNRSLIVSGRFHDCELSGNPDMKDFRCLAHIPPESNTDLIACISDILLQGWTVCLEPEYNVNMALDYILINKPNYLNMTTSFFIEAAKQYLYDKRHKGKLLDFIFTAFAVGEKMSNGEEKLINKMLRKGKAGRAVKVNGFTMPFVPIGGAAGDCEHGAIFYTLWKQLFGLKSKMFGIDECGLYPEAYVNSTVLKINDKGEYEECDYGEFGLIVSNSYSNMTGYKNLPEETKKLLVRDNLGRTWLSCNTCGYIDKLGGVHIHGRKELLFTKSSKGTISLYDIEKAITLDTKNVLSCQISEENEIITVVIQPQSDVSEYLMIESAKNRLKKFVDMSVLERIEFIVLPFREQFPLTHSGKRELTNRTIIESVHNFEQENDKGYSKIKTMKAI